MGSFGKLWLPAVLTLTLPLAGIIAAGLPLERYLEFPPLESYVIHAPFSASLFAGGSALFLFLAAFLLHGIARGFKGRGGRWSKSRSMPWWGWAAFCVGIVFWLLAWTRFSWFSSLQRHTFLPLWLCYIVCVNALTEKGRGTCPMLSDPGSFLFLFPASAIFWWLFEFLNRFVQNWSYQNVGFSSFEYALYATISFSTVLPAVRSTQALLQSRLRLKRGFDGISFFRFDLSAKRAFVLLLLSSSTLFAVGVWPNYLFPLLWLSPLMILVSIQAIKGSTHIFDAPLKRGDWSEIGSFSLAALVCGFFWEMWNFLSLARWHYSIPFVDACRIFEMPLLGYMGYIPFGMECMAVIRILEEGGVRKKVPPAY